MSYSPSHRMPPRQERWPTATPAEGWPSYRDGEQEDQLRYGAQGATAGYRQQATATAAYPAVTNGYAWSGRGYAGTADGYAGTADGYAGAADDFDGAQGGYGRAQGGYGRADRGYAASNVGYADAGNGYAEVDDGYARADDGYSWPTAAYAGDAGGYDWSGNGYGDGAHGYGANGYGEAADGYGGGAYPGPGSYVEPGPVHQDHPTRVDDPMLGAPDAGVHPDHWQAEQDLRREAGRRGPMVGAVTVVLGTGVVIGVSTLAAALLKSVTSPASAMGAVFIERTPTALRNAVVHQFGAQGRSVLLLGMYVAVAVVAIAIGMMARRDAAACVAGVAAFTLVAAFVVITRPASHVADVAPVIIGGLAGVAAVLWLFRAAAPPGASRPAPIRHGNGGSRRRTR